jgi:hypothetical protein
MNVSIVHSRVRPYAHYQPSATYGKSQDEGAVVSRYWRNTPDDNVTCRYTNSIAVHNYPSSVYSGVLRSRHESPAFQTVHRKLQTDTTHRTVEKRHARALVSLQERDTELPKDHSVVAKYGGSYGGKSVLNTADPTDLSSFGSGACLTCLGFLARVAFRCRMQAHTIDTTTLSNTIAIKTPNNAPRRDFQRSGSLI